MQQQVYAFNTIEYNGPIKRCDSTHESAIAQRDLILEKAVFDAALRIQVRAIGQVVSYCLHVAINHGQTKIRHHQRRLCSHRGHPSNKSID